MAKTNTTEQWYQADADKLPKAVCGFVDAVRRRNSWWEKRLAIYLALYGGDRYAGASSRPRVSASGMPRPQLSASNAGRPGLKLNIVGPIVDAATNRMCEGRPRPVFTTKRGDWKLQRTARDRTKLLEGIMQQGRFFKVRQRTIRSAAVCGNGWGVPVWEDGRIVYQYIPPGEMVVDDFEGQEDMPRSVARERLIDFEKLCKMYPGKRAEIEKSSRATPGHYGYDSRVDQVVMHEIWHLPSKPGASDGLFVRCTSNALLTKIKLERPRYPVVAWTWGDPVAGWRGEGVIERIMGIQREINSVLRTIAANVYAGGNLKVAVERGSVIDQIQLSNALGGVRIDYTGTPPTFFAPDVFSPQLMAYLERLVAYAYQIARVSELSASSEVPAGLTGSGRSMLVHQNIEAKNFISVGRNDEDSVLDMAVRTLDLASDMGADFEVVYRSRSWIEKYKAKDLLKNPDAFEIQVQPASWLPATVPGRVAIAEEMRMQGYWSKEQAAKMADIPVDPESELDLESAPLDLIDRRIEMILDDGEARSPHPRMNLTLYIKRASLAYQRAEERNYPKERLAMLGKSIDMAIRLRKQGLGIENALAPPMPTDVPPGAQQVPPGMQKAA